MTHRQMCVTLCFITLMVVVLLSCPVSIYFSSRSAVASGAVIHSGTRQRQWSHRAGEHEKGETHTHVMYMVHSACVYGVR